jgi:hypothetical protein
MAVNGMGFNGILNRISRWSPKKIARVEATGSDLEIAYC